MKLFYIVAVYQMGMQNGLATAIAGRIIITLITVQCFCVSVNAQVNGASHRINNKDTVKSALFDISAEYDNKVDIFGNIAPTKPAADINTFEYTAKSGFDATLATYNETDDKSIVNELDLSIGWKGVFLNKGDWSADYTRYIITGVPGAADRHGFFPNGYKAETGYGLHYIYTSLTANLMAGAKYPGYDFALDWQLTRDINIFHSKDSSFSIVISPSNDLLDGHVSSLFFFAQKGREKLKAKTDVTNMSYSGLLEDVVSVPLAFNIGAFSIIPQANYVIGFHQFPNTITVKKTTYLNDNPFFYFSCTLEFQF